MSPDLEQSFDEFVAGRYTALRRTGYLLSGDWHLAEDLVQITLVKLYARWPRLRDPESAAGYARTTLVRSYIDTRRRRRSHEVTAPDVPDAPGAGASEDPERRLALLSALAQVTPAYRAALVLRFWEDQTIEATAAVLRQSTGTVKSNTSRGLAQLRTILGDSLHEIAAL
ncbi:SigE family RNA polymerase sigma factor [Streptomyces kaniharaensis]|uniref:SigE family RNA polymerase sigma factor n=1 Tax=Streptomyces kaniharaensis TaxID=212423 RepID=A0A6N7KKR2_9ACTN|nr:SigE family RNA polymerase sigma factor [Streptomyces kaniharaensis]MQS11961.1 SigE family RNA polymerase sigma factor [Streptomyces kaniharaensis]